VSTLPALGFRASFTNAINNSLAERLARCATSDKTMILLIKAHIKIDMG